MSIQQNPQDKFCDHPFWNAAGNVGAGLLIFFMGLSILCWIISSIIGIPLIQIPGAGMMICVYLIVGADHQRLKEDRLINRLKGKEY